jgi:hypothetical protein
MLLKILAPRLLSFSKLKQSFIHPLPMMAKCYERWKEKRKNNLA